MYTYPIVWGVKKDLKSNKEQCIIAFPLFVLVYTLYVRLEQSLSVGSSTVQLPISKFYNL